MSRGCRDIEPMAVCRSCPLDISSCRALAREGARWPREPQQWLTLFAEGGRALRQRPVARLGIEQDRPDDGLHVPSDMLRGPIVVVLLDDTRQIATAWIAGDEAMDK